MVSAHGRGFLLRLLPPRALSRRSRRAITSRGHDRRSDSDHLSKGGIT